MTAQDISPQGVEALVHIGNEWDGLLADQFQSEYYKTLRRFLVHEYDTRTVFPPAGNIFNALKLTPYNSVKAVILGQDPYHGDGQAHGLSFSVLPGVEPPPSLKNIYKEIEDDTGIHCDPACGCLEHWARQGVLLLNTTLTVIKGSAGSHRGHGWEMLTDRIIALLNERESPTVFLLWGANAKAKLPLITNKKHLCLTAAHPSPLSAYNGFFGCRHFSRTNAFLSSNGIEPIDWKISAV